jgi:sulfite oxidase
MIAGSLRDAIIHTREPLNGEPSPGRLTASFLTPVGDFYLRCHGTIPRIDPASYRLQIGGLVRAPLQLSLDDLRSRFPTRTIAAVLQCAGNRRGELNAVHEVSGAPWAAGAIGHAEWTGVALPDVLKAAIVASECPDLHVAFSCHDRVEMPGEGRFAYGASIPIAKATAPEVLLAWAMNGEALTPEHGFPLRLVVPGFAGVRSAKWLDRVTVQRTPSDNPIQQRDYKMLPAEVTEATVDWSQGVPIDEMPLTSAICEPAPRALLRAGPTVIRGYALSTGRRVVRVEVSGDGGRSWRQAALEQRPVSPWSWTLWRASMTLATGAHELAVRAWDSAGQTQPARPEEVWNFKGYLNASWHRIRVRAE